jgi:predicted DNA-binding protein
MTRLRMTTLRLEDELLEGLQQVKERDGIPVAEQIRRAVKAWLEAKGVRKAERQRAVTRKRS